MIKAVKEAAEQLNFKFDQKINAAAGEYQGYTVLISAEKNDNKKGTIVFHAVKDGAVIEPNTLTFNGLPVMQMGYKFICTLSAGKKKQENVDNIVSAVAGMANALNGAGCVNCDQEGTGGYSEVYVVQGNCEVLSSSAVAEEKARMHTIQEEYKAVKEKPLLGIVGALLGSMAGIVVILLLGRFNLISVLGGAALGLGIVFGYKKLGKKISTGSAVFCIVLAFVMTYIAFRLDAGVDCYKACEGQLSFTESIRYTKKIYQLADAMSTYYRNLLLNLLCGVGGAVACIYAERESDKEQIQMRKLGEKE